MFYTVSEAFQWMVIWAPSMSDSESTSQRVEKQLRSFRAVYCARYHIYIVITILWLVLTLGSRHCHLALEAVGNEGPTAAKLPTIYGSLFFRFHARARETHCARRTGNAKTVKLLQPLASASNPLVRKLLPR